MLGRLSRQRQRLSTNDVVQNILNSDDDDDGDIPSGSEDERLESGSSADERYDSDEDPAYSEDENSEGSVDGDESKETDDDNTDDVPTQPAKHARHAATSNKPKRKVLKWTHADIKDSGDLPENELLPRGEIKKTANQKLTISY
ncbi:uncharacterized protein LOC141900633 [Tubulanus polymorphus]|uniref:uncharacterized protein LOC141900633 n=1 Tax=Tubulanus polymorphus TaxID=672921 RepID=UPI003DA37D02